MPRASEGVFKQLIRKKSKVYGWLPVTLTPPPVGIPDLMLLKNGKTVFVEVKFKSHRMSAIQHEMMNLLAEKGFSTYAINKVGRFMFEVFDYTMFTKKEYISLDKFFDKIGMDIFLA